MKERLTVNIPPSYNSACFYSEFQLRIDLLIMGVTLSVPSLEKPAKIFGKESAQILKDGLSESSKTMRSSVEYMGEKHEKGLGSIGLGIGLGFAFISLSLLASTRMIGK